MAKQRNIERPLAAKGSSATDHRIDAVARRQHLIVERGQLLGVGVTRDEIQSRLDRGRIRPVFRGVYVVGPMPPTRLGMWKAGTLAVSGSLLCGRRALEHHALIDVINGPVHVAATRRTRPQPGLIPHRAAIRDSWTTRKDGIPTVVPMLAVAQCAPTLGPTTLRKALERAEIRRLLDVPLPEEILAAHPNLKHRRRLLAEIKPFRATTAATETNSSLEIRFLRAARSRGHRPATNVPIDRYEVDFYWPGASLIVETDGFEPHRSRTAFDRDRARWARLTSLGFPLIIVTDHRLNTDEDGLFAEIEAVLARAGVA